MHDSFYQLADAWREEAERLRERYGADRLAHLSEVHARELERLVNAGLDEELTLTEAADLSGYSKSHLRHLVSEGEIPNAGRKGRPRIRRADLPRKDRRAGHRDESADVAGDWERLGMPDPGEEARRPFDESPGTGRVN